jgi:enoyl-CoA hydratase/carnithine racemase
MPDNVLVAVEERICRIQMHRPEKKNALTAAMYAALADAVLAAGADPAVRVLLIAGTESVFSAGNDIADFAGGFSMDEGSPVVRFLDALVGAAKPIVAAVNGPAIGIGTTMLLHCDLAYAGRSARFQLPFVNLGLVPEAGSSYLLPRMVGHARAAELLMLGEPFDAETARACGIVNAVVDDAEALPRALAAAHALAAKPPAALRLTKQMLKQAGGDTLRQVIRAEAEQFRARLAAPEAAEAFQAFMERRKPDFSRFA